MASDVDICNMGLRHLGVAKIVSLTEAGSQAARDCALFYTSCVDATLRGHRWSFAQKRRRLAAFTAPSDYVGKYTQAYVFPADCLKSHNVYQAVEGADLVDTEPQNFEIYRAPTGEQIIMTNALNAVLEYTMNVHDATWFNAEFIEAVALYLGSILATPLTKNMELKKVLFEQYRLALDQAGASNVEEHTPEPDDTVPWIDARGGIG